MSGVEFNQAVFATRYPAFSGVSPVLLEMFFVEASQLVDNTEASIITNLTEREIYLYLMMAHLMQLNGIRSDGTTASDNGLVGRISSATEGSVSVSVDYPQQQSAMGAWLSQTKYGAQYWAMTSKYRTFRFNPVARHRRIYESL